jgi:C4-dicarboxylate-specific signal transduction histidine kinase
MHTIAQDVAEMPFRYNGTREGTGLGLAISAYVMQLLGGRLSYRKDPRLSGTSSRHFVRV